MQEALFRAAKNLMLAHERKRARRTGGFRRAEFFGAEVLESMARTLGSRDGGTGNLRGIVTAIYNAWCARGWI
jgi:hypothetical protein